MRFAIAIISYCQISFTIRLDCAVKVFAEKFRGFEDITIDMDKMTFLVGDNSSGKSSLIYLIDAVCRSGLNHPPQLDEDFGISQFDYFSPYFGRDDVIFGFFDDDDQSKFAKVITVNEGSDGTPLITRCTYWVASYVITVKLDDDKLYVRVMKDAIDVKLGDLKEAHKDNSDFSATEELKFSDTELSLGAQIVPVIATSELDLDRDEIFKYLFRSYTPEPRLVSPLRAMPERYYQLKRKFSTRGSHFPVMWIDFQDADGGESRDRISRFGKESGLFDQFEVRKVAEDVIDSPLVVVVEKNGQSFMLNQVGIGVSQIVPVMVDSVFALNGENMPLLVQQPELHLHPVAQAAFGSYLFSCVENGLKGVVETHSSFLLDRFRSEIRDLNRRLGEHDETPVHEHIEILFCRNDSSGNSAHVISFDEKGRLINDPDEYHSFFVDELVRTMV